MVESVIGEIQHVKRLGEGDCSKLINFINVLDTGYRDLKNLELESEISNAHVVNISENKLPRQLELEWYRYVYRSKSPMKVREKFPCLLKFLQIERSALEYSTSELKTKCKQVNMHTCLIHGNVGHNTKDCRQYKSYGIADRYSLVKDSYACYGCLHSGHQLKECPNRVICGDGCDKYHHKSLHDNRTNTVHSISNFTVDDNRLCLLPIMKINVFSPYCNSLIYPLGFRSQYNFNIEF